MRFSYRTLILSVTGAAVSGVVGFLVPGPRPAAAAARSLTVVSPSEVLSTSSKVKGKKVGYVCFGNTPGHTKSTLDGLLQFSTLADEIKALDLKAKKKDKKAAATESVYKALTPLAKLNCKALAKLSPTKTPTPVPGVPTNTPIPTPTQNPRAMFDNQGNVTPLGKSFLGIDSNFNANIDQGDAAFQFTCKGCHTGSNPPPVNLVYSQVVPTISQSPMNIQVPDALSYQDIYNIIAYINRFRMNVP